MRPIDADTLSEHKFVGNKFIQIGGRRNGKILEAVNRVYQQGWNDAIDAIVDNAPTVERPRGKLIIKNHMETCEKCGSVMPMMNGYYRAKLRGCPYCLTEFTNLADMRKEEEE